MNHHQNISLAVKFGWRVRKSNWLEKLFLFTKFVIVSPSGVIRIGPPSYNNSLNDLRDLELQLTTAQKLEYDNLLNNTLLNINKHRKPRMYVWELTAQERADALCILLNIEN